MHKCAMVSNEMASDKMFSINQYTYKVHIIAANIDVGNVMYGY